MNKSIKIMDRSLFSGALNEITLKDLELKIGKLSSGNYGVASIKLDPDDPKYHDKVNWLTNNLSQVNFALQLPPEAADIWIVAYDNALVDKGVSADEASNIAMAEVRKQFYKDDRGRWIKLSEKWFNEVGKQIEPTIEIIKTGTFRDSVGDSVEVTAQMLDEMVTNFDKKVAIPAITNDHRKDGPSFGKIKKLFKIGNSLFGTLTDLTSKFIEKVRNKEYVHRSAEFFKDYIDGKGMSHGAVLSVVSFLGVKQPAIKDMALPEFSESGTAYALSIDKSEFCIKLTEHKPSNKKGVGLKLELTEEQLNARIEKAKAEGVAEADSKHKDELKKLSDENKALKNADKQRREQNAKDQAEKRVKHFASKEGGGKILPAQIEHWKGQFEKAYLSEKSEDEIKELESVLEAMPNVVEFTEITKQQKENEDGNPKAGKGSVEFSEANQKEMGEIADELEKRKVKFSLNSQGMIIFDDPKDNSKFGEALAAVRARKK